MSSGYQSNDHQEEAENHERWVISYADFITLLFAFFVVMYATSNQNKEKEKKFQDSLRQELKLAGGAGPGSGEDGSVSSGLTEQVEELLNPIKNTPNLMKAKGVGPAELKDYVSRQIERQLTEEERKNLIQSVRHDSIGVRVRLAATALFPSGSAKLKAAAIEGLNNLAQTLEGSEHKLIIEGHTDDQPISTGDFESNWELAGARASQVVRYLIKVHGFEASKIAAISYADQRPIASNDSEEGRSQNRRIEILIVTDPNFQ